MDELQTYDFGFDYRGPSSSEDLNAIMEKIGIDLSNLSAANIRLNQEMISLAKQSYKQEMGMFRKILELSNEARDSGTTCAADLADPSVVLTTDHDEVSIPAGQRLLHNASFGVITPPYTGDNRLAWTATLGKVARDGVEAAVQVITENGSISTIDPFQAFTGHPPTSFERAALVGSPQSAEAIPEISLFVRIPPASTGMGYPLSNYVTFIPFPIYTESIRFYYTTDYTPVLSRTGSSWSDTPDYVDSLDITAGAYRLTQAPIWASFPEVEISAIRIDIKQPFYIVDGGSCIYSYGIGALELGYVKPTTTTAIGTVQINKPTGVFTSITDTHVVMDNIASADVDEVLSTVSWVDDGDASIAYVELTILPNAISSGQVPVVTSVSVDYT